MPWVPFMTAASDILKNRMSGFIGRLVAPVALATILLLAAVLSLIWVAARGQDEVAAQSSSELLGAVLLNMRNDLGQLVYDYAWWDNAVENLILRPDREWADSNIGIHAAETFDISATFVVSDTDTTLFAYRNGVLSRDRAFSYFGESLHALIAQARVTPMVEPAPVTAFVRTAQGVFLVAVSALTPENPTPEEIVYRPRPVLIHARHLSPELVGTLAERFGFNNLVLSENAPPATMDRLALALPTASGEVAAWAVWQPPHPGYAVFVDVLPWLLAGFLVLGGLILVFVRRVLQAAQAMALDAKELAFKERQLAQTSKLAVLGEMAAGVVHELNQPLNIIRMATDSTRASLQERGSQADPEQLSEQLSVIGGQTRRMAETIQSMRIFSRDDYGRKIAFDVVRATNQALSWLRPDLAEHRIEVSFQAPPRCGRVFGEPSRFEQVMVNLILNARDAVRARKADGLIEGCEIAIEITEQRSTDTVFITIRDNGGGVPDEHIERVFEPFFTTKEPGEGTGLGLSISYGIIGGMDGELAVRNNGDGAEFTIKLPGIAAKTVAETTISEEDRG